MTHPELFSTQNFPPAASFWSCPPPLPLLEKIWIKHPSRFSTRGVGGSALDRSDLLSARDELQDEKDQHLLVITPKIGHHSSMSTQNLVKSQFLLMITLTVTVSPIWWHSPRDGVSLKESLNRISLELICYRPCYIWGFYYVSLVGHHKGNSPFKPL